MQVLTIDSQENLGCLQEERPAGPGIISIHVPSGGNRKPLPQGVHRRHILQGNVGGGEFSGLEWGHSNVVRSGAPSPTGFLHRDAETIPTGVGINVARHPMDRQGVLSCGKLFPVGLIVGDFSGRGEGKPRTGVHLTPCQEGRVGVYGSNLVHPRSLYGLLCCHRPPGCWFLGPDWVPYRQPHHDTDRGMGKDIA